MLTFSEAERAFQLDPPPEPESEGFAAFLHFYEPSLNERVRRFLGKRAFDAETLLEYKLACAAAMLERWERFDPRIGSRFETFVHSTTPLPSWPPPTPPRRPARFRALTSTRLCGRWPRSCMARRREIRKGSS